MCTIKCEGDERGRQLVRAARRLQYPADRDGYHAAAIVPLCYGPDLQAPHPRPTLATAISQLSCAAPTVPPLFYCTAFSLGIFALRALSVMTAVRPVRILSEWVSTPTHIVFVHSPLLSSPLANIETRISTFYINKLRRAIFHSDQT